MIKKSNIIFKRLKYVALLVIYCSNIISQDVVHVSALQNGQGILRQYKGECYVILPQHVLGDNPEFIIIDSSRQQINAVVEAYYPPDIAIAKVQDASICNSQWLSSNWLNIEIKKIDNAMITSLREDGSIKRRVVVISEYDDMWILVRVIYEDEKLFQGLSGSMLTRDGKLIGQLISVDSNNNMGKVLRQDFIDNVLKNRFGDTQQVIESTGEKNTSNIKPFLDAIAILEHASNYRSKLDMGQVNAVETLASIEKPIAGISLDEVYFQSGNYKKLKISNSSFIQSDFSSSNLDHSLIIESNFEFSNFTNSALVLANISNSDFDFAILKNTKFNQSKITNSSMKAVQAERASFVNSSIKNVKFTGSSLKEADFTNAKLEDVSFVNTDLTDALFNDAVFLNVTFTGAKLNIVEQISKTQLKNTCSHKGSQNYVRIFYERKNLEGGTELESLVSGTLVSRKPKSIPSCKESNKLHLDTIRADVPLGYKRSKYRSIACEIYTDLFYCN